MRQLDFHELLSNNSKEHVPNVTARSSKGAGAASLWEHQQRSSVSIEAFAHDRFLFDGAIESDKSISRCINSCSIK